MTHTSSGESLARPGPVLTFEGAGSWSDGVFLVAERVDATSAALLVVRWDAGEKRFHLHLHQLREDGTGQDIARDPHPLHDFNGAVGPMPSAGGGGRPHPFDPTPAQLLRHVLGVMRAAGLPPLPDGLKWELNCALAWVFLAIHNACRRLTPGKGQAGPEHVRRWESLCQRFGSACLVAADAGLSDELRDALAGSGINFDAVWRAWVRAIGDTKRVTTVAPEHALGIDHMDRAAAGSFRRLKGMIPEQYDRAAKSRARRGKEEPDPEVMEARLEEGAATLESGKNPKNRTWPRNVLVKSPPSAPQKNFPNDEQLSVSGPGESPSRHDPENPRAVDALETLEAAEAEQALRGLARCPVDHAIIDALKAGAPRGCWSEIAEEFGVEPSTVTRRRDTLWEQGKRAAS